MGCRTGSPGKGRGMLASHATPLMANVSAWVTVASFSGECIREVGSTPVESLTIQESVVDSPVPASSAEFWIWNAVVSGAIWTR